MLERFISTSAFSTWQSRSKFGSSNQSPPVTNRILFPGDRGHLWIMQLLEGVTKALEQELRWGSKLLAHRERVMNQQASRQARAQKQDIRFKKQKSMQHVGSIPAEEFFAFASNPKFKGCWGDDEFVKDYFKRNPHLRSNK